MMKINPHDAGIMKKQGFSVENLEIVENFFIPTPEDIQRLSKALQDCETIVDIGSGYGLLITELAKQNQDKQFLGIDTMYWDKHFKKPKAMKNLRFMFTGIEAMTHPVFKPKRFFDAVICCWMPEGSDWRGMLGFLAKKKVILILSYFFATGTKETWGGMRPFGFTLEDHWKSDKSIITIWKKKN